jgi:PIN domain
MATIKEAVGALSADKVPVLCLDTCDFLDVVRELAEGNLFHVGSFRRILTTLDLAPGRLGLVVTYLVRHEWERNKIQVGLELEKFLDDAATSALRIAEARKLGNLPALFADPGLFDSTLVQKLVELAEDVMNHAVILEKDDSCVALALDRVMDGRWPSHRNEIKDSIHWEHYLELSRQLGAAGHAQARIFVSANKADFWANRDSPAIHPDLEAEARAAGLRFFGRLDEALRSLGI